MSAWIKELLNSYANNKLSNIRVRNVENDEGGTGVAITSDTGLFGALIHSDNEHVFTITRVKVTDTDGQTELVPVVVGGKAIETDLKDSMLDTSPETLVKVILSTMGVKSQDPSYG